MGDLGILHSASNNWIVDVKCPFYEKFLPLFEDQTLRGDDESNIKTTLNGYQFDVTPVNLPVWGDNKPMDGTVDYQELMTWVMTMVRRNGIPVKSLKVIKTWCVDYNDGGYQIMHSHGNGCISMVMAMDDTVGVGERVSKDNGMLYSLMPNPDTTQEYNQFAPYPGRTVIMDGRVWHGVYPCKAPRRTWVVDFEYEYFKPDEEFNPQDEIK
jgi:hypothetical protein